MKRRQLVAESTMHPAGIVPIQPVDKRAVKIINEQQCSGMVIGKFFLDGAVKPFKMRIHFGTLGIGMVMKQAELLQGLGEMLLEFGTVVGEDIGNGKRKQPNHLGKEFLQFDRIQQHHVAGIQCFKVLGLP